jgi:hypothetical protein
MADQIATIINEVANAMADQINTDTTIINEAANAMADQINTGTTIINGATNTTADRIGTDATLVNEDSVVGPVAAISNVTGGLVRA